MNQTTEHGDKGEFYITVHEWTFGMTEADGGIRFSALREEF